MFLFQSMPSGDPCALVDHEFAKTLARSLRASLRMQALWGVKPIQHKFHVYFNDIMTLSSKSVPAKKAFFFLQNLNVSVLFPNSILFTPKMGMEHQAVQTLSPGQSIAMCVGCPGGERKARADGHVYVGQEAVANEHVRCQIVSASKDEKRH
jgi:hypothetical protein